MSNHHPFSQLRSRMSPKSMAASENKSRSMREEMALNELRKAYSFSQEKIAKTLHIQQPAVAKLEKRTDMYISTLRNYIEALGGELDIVARFPKTEVHLQNFTSLKTRRRIKETSPKHLIS